jgi:hypothetical protein
MHYKAFPPFATSMIAPFANKVVTNIYDGNEGTITPSVTLKNLHISACPHFASSEIGDPILVEL